MINGVIDVCGLTDKGTVREENQDRVFCAQEGGEALCVMADGMGGCDDGSFASSAVVKAAGQFWENREGVALDSIFYDSHAEILEYQRESGKKCGTTGTVLYIKDNGYRIIHAGDSRCYMMDGFWRKRLAALTSDDTFVARALANGDITPAQAVNHPKRHALVNCLGIREAFTISRAEGAVKRGMKFMLCSDGLYNEVTEEEIKAALSKGKSARAAAEALLKTALGKSAKDNVSVVIARVYS